MSAHALIEARGLVRDLDGAVRARVLQGIDLDVHAGEFAALTGASGSGKSTLLYLLGALDRPTEGRVLLEGVDVDALDDDERAELRSAKLGFVFQFHFLLPEFTALENVCLPVWRRGVRRAVAESRAKEALAAVGIADLAHRLPREMSGGQQQRVSIARAVAKQPRVILADEPTGSLDSKSGEAVIGLFERLVAERGVALVMVTHERAFAARAHRNLEMRDGRMCGREGEGAPVAVVEAARARPSHREPS